MTSTAGNQSSLSKLRPTLETDQAVGNIEKLVNGLGLDLYTEVVNWEQMNDLPQDTSFFSSLYKFARQYKIKHVITGPNFTAEC